MAPNQTKFAIKIKYNIIIKIDILMSYIVNMKIDIVCLLAANNNNNNIILLNDRFRTKNKTLVITFYWTKLY